MLVLTRKPRETLYIGDVEVTILRVVGNRVKLGITGPKDTIIVRGELRATRPDDTSSAPGKPA